MTKSFDSQKAVEDVAVAIVKAMGPTKRGDNYLFADVLSSAIDMAHRACRAISNPTWWEVNDNAKLNECMARLRVRLEKELELECPRSATKPKSSRRQPKR